MCIRDRPYTLQNTLEYGGKFFVCGTGRQPILRNKMENENYYLLTLAAIAKEIQQRGAETECSVTIAAGLPLAGFGREKKSFREYLRPSSQPVSFQFEGIPYKVTIEDVELFPQGYSALMIHPELLQNEPSVLPVSYTHLEQLLRRYPGEGPPALRGRAGGGQVPRALLRHIPVSYTHLAPGRRAPAPRL